MDRAGYLTVLKARAAAASRPVLSDAEVDAILDLHRTPDRDGRRTDDTDWTPTYDLNAAGAEAWRQKAGKVAGDFSFSADDASYQKADVLAHCLEMEAKYAAQTHGTLHAAHVPLDYSWDGTLVP